VAVCALCLGLINSVDNPTRHSFVMEMVGADRLRTAVSLNATMMNLACIVGPAIAGVVIGLAGMPPCFIINSLSYGAVVGTLLAIHPDQLFTTVRTGGRGGRILEGSRYAFTAPIERNPLLMLAIIGTFTIEYQVSLPLLAEFAFGGNAGAYAALSSAQGIGAVIGGIITASRATTTFGTMVLAAALLGLAALFASSMPTRGLAVTGVVLLGLCSIYFQSTANTTVQLGSDPQMRDRIMALWSMAGPGSSAIGAPAIGFIGEHIGARAGLATGGIAALAAAGFGLLMLRRELSLRSQETVNEG
jgi:MFS family permease